MGSLQAYLRRHSLTFGLALMFAYTWPIDLAHSQVLPIRIPFPVYITLGWGFIFAALIMTALTQGPAALVSLLKQFLIWKTHWKWYLVALALFPTIDGLAVLLWTSVTRVPIDFDQTTARQIFGFSAHLPTLILPYFLFDALTNGEEMGWRGYVLPRLLAKYRPLTATLILGMIWAVWHLPKFLGQASPATFAWFVAKILAESVLYTWLFSNTGGSLLLTTLFHASGNTAAVFLPMTTTIFGDNDGVLIVSILMRILVAGLVVLLSDADFSVPGMAKYSQP